MNQMKLLLPIFMLIIALPSLHTNAQSINYLTCDDCSYAEQKSLAVLSGRNGKVNVIDFKTIEANSFYVFNEPGQHSAVEATPSVDLTSGIEELRAFKHQLDSLIKGKISISAISPYMFDGSSFNVVDLVRNPSMQADVAQAIGKYYENNIIASVRTISGAFGSTALSTVITAQYVVTVQFGTNGDTFQFKFTSLNINPDGRVGYEFTAKTDSGRSEGVMIIATGNGAFQVRGAAANVEAFINKMGFTVSGSFGGRGSVSIGCEGTIGHPCLLSN